MHLCSRVAHRNGARGVVLDVILQIALHRSDVWRIGLGSGDIVNDLVAGKEAKRVRIVLEGFDDGEDVVEIVGIVAITGIRAIDGLSRKRAVDIQQQVNAHGVEDGHAFVVIQCRIDIVGADGIDAQGLEQGGIAQADGGIAQGVTTAGAICSLSTRLIVHAHNHEALSIVVRDDKLLLVDFDGIDGGGESRVGAKKGGDLSRSMVNFPFHRIA